MRQVRNRLSRPWIDSVFRVIIIFGFGECLFNEDVEAFKLLIQIICIVSSALLLVLLRFDQPLWAMNGVFIAVSTRKATGLEQFIFITILMFIITNALGTWFRRRQKRGEAPESR